MRRKILLSGQTSNLGDSTPDASSMNRLNELLETDLQEEDVMGRLVIDLESIISQRAEDIILESGDTLTIPKFNQSISVIGEVFVENSHFFKDSLTLEDYLELSGGLTSFADESNIYIIKSDGSIVAPTRISSGFFRSFELEQGDTIVVPLEGQPFSSVRAATEITQIIYQMAVAAAAVGSF